MALSSNCSCTIFTLSNMKRKHFAIINVLIQCLHWVRVTLQQVDDKSPSFSYCGNLLHSEKGQILRSQRVASVAHTCIHVLTHISCVTLRVSGI